MVNTGKPSTGCHMCRARRIKCDEAKPHCMRCQKSKRVCPGYRDALELKLRDETRSTKKKPVRFPRTYQVVQGDSIKNDYSMVPYRGRSSSVSSRRGSDCTSANPSPTSTISSVALSLWSCRQALSLVSSKGLSTPVDQQVYCFFLSNYVLIPEEGSPRGFFDFLLPLLRKEQSGSPLSVTFSAVAMAAFGGRAGLKAVLPRAEALYVKALNQINLVLQDPEKALTDETLASVVLLGFYETLTSSQLTIKGWISHVEGAVALVKSRGKKQLGTQIGRDLFLAIKSQMTMAYIANSKHVKFGHDWWVEMPPSDQVSRTVNELNLRVADLRADSDAAISMAPRTSENLENVLSLIRDAEALEQRYLEWFESLPPHWRPRTTAWVDFVPRGDLSTSACYPGRIETYSELWMAGQYVIALSSRLFVSTTILRCIASLSFPSDYRITPQFTDAARLCTQIIEDIVASVPYFFDVHFADDSPASLSHFACGHEQKGAPKGLAGVLSLWPIFVAATSDFCSETQRTWLVGKMKYIDQCMGIGQSALLIQAKEIRYPSMFIYRDSMNLPPSNCKVPPSLPGSPDTSEPELDDEFEEESDFILRLREARRIQAEHTLN